MVLNTVTVSFNVAPVVVATFIRHYVDRKAHQQKPTADLSYHEGLHLIRQFLHFSSKQTVEDLQRFTGRWVPSPSWVKVDVVTIPSACIAAAAETLHAQLGPRGIELVGGKTWWQWRLPGTELQAEWIEMQSDRATRKKSGDSGKRIMLYLHGGAYFFGSVDMHRYQLQRHARKLKARVFARLSADEWTTRYRLAPQFPFPCALQDCLAAYLFLLTLHDASTIVVAGDSAGGGMVLSLLVIMRDRGINLPAGAILISPWVDLTHSFPSVADENELDFIPTQGFHTRPSPAWPPPNEGNVNEQSNDKNGAKVVLGRMHLAPSEASTSATKPPDGNTNLTTANSGSLPGCGLGLSIPIRGGHIVPITEQMQLYTTNQLIAHPLVSPVLQASLGGLPPLLILAGGGETLRDEQLFVAHKAAHPARYAPSRRYLDVNGHHEHVRQWKPTYVQLQVWDDLCHVAPTLSFTRPAKYMYRSIAQFGAWALVRAEHTEIDIQNDDDVSIIPSESEAGPTPQIKNLDSGPTPLRVRSGQIGKAGDPLPPFKNYMIRQRVDCNGNIYPLESASKLPACNLSPDEIGVIKEGPVLKWMMAKRESDAKFASSKRRVQNDRAKGAEGHQTFEGEVPPPSALAGRWRKGNRDHTEKSKRSWGMSLWSSWGSKHDKDTVQREQQADKSVESAVVTDIEGPDARHSGETEAVRGKAAKTSTKSRSRSRQRTIADDSQVEQSRENDENKSVLDVLSSRKPDTPKQDDKRKGDEEKAEEEEQSSVKQQEEGKEETDTQKETNEDEDALQSWFQASNVLHESEKPPASPVGSALGQPIVVKKPEVERFRPDSSVLGIRLVTETKSESQNFDFPFSSPKTVPEMGLPVNAEPEKVISVKAEDAGLDFDFGLLKSPTAPLSPLSSKGADEGLAKYDSKSPVDKFSFEKVPAKTSFDQPTAKLSIDKAEAEGLRPQSPHPKTSSIVEPSPSKESTPNVSKGRKTRPKSTFVTSLKRALTKRSVVSATPNNSLAIPVGRDHRISKSSGSNQEVDWKSFEANGTGHINRLSSNEKAYESGIGIKKSLSTRDPKRAPLAKSTTWKADEVSGGLHAQPSVSKRPLPMLKKDYVPPPTALKKLESMAEDDELLKPKMKKDQEPDAISDYLTW